MTIMVAQILTPYTGTGQDMDAFRPALADDYQVLTWVDVTGQAAENLIPDPNLVLIEVICEAAVLSQIEGNNRYQVIYSEEQQADEEVD